MTNPFHNDVDSLGHVLQTVDHDHKTFLKEELSQPLATCVKWPYLNVICFFLIFIKKVSKGCSGWEQLLHLYIGKTNFILHR